MYSPLLQLTRYTRDRRGIALPLALLGLIVVTVIITGALLTGSTELALSHAHQDATRNLYIAEAAGNSYIAREVITGPVTEAYTPPTRPSSEAATIFVERLLRQTTGANVPADSAYIYSVTAVPAGGGRGVSTQVAVDRMGMRQFIGSIDAALTCDSCQTNGSAVISNGGDGQYCNPADSVQNAVTFSSDGDFDSGGNATVRGDTTRSNLGAEDLFLAVLGAPIRDFAFAADLKFGNIFNEQSFTGQNTTSKRKVRGQWQPAPKGPYNWGCPGAMDTWTDCYRVSGMDTTYAPIVAIDAEGGTVSLNGDHGQGMVIVINGDLQINGNFVYRGIIVSEGGVHINGAGGNQGGAKIEGAVIAARAVEFSNDTTMVNGNSVIRYNKCAIDLATNSFNNNTNRYGAPTVRGRNFSWFEVTR